MNDFPSTSFKMFHVEHFPDSSAVKAFLLLAFLCSLLPKSIFSRLICISPSTTTRFPAHTLCFFPCESAFAGFFYPLAVLPYFGAIVNKYAQNRYEPLFRAFTITFSFFPAKNRFHKFSFLRSFYCEFSIYHGTFLVVLLL